MTHSLYVTTVTITDPDSGGEVEVCIFKDEGGGMFGVDQSFLVQCFDDNEVIRIPNVFSDNKGETQLNGIN